MSSACGSTSLMWETPSTGQPMPWGGRQEIDYTHPAFKFYAERVIRKIVSRYADHPAIIGFQVDNEPGIALKTPCVSKWRKPALAKPAPIAAIM